MIFYLVVSDFGGFLKLQERERAEHALLSFFYASSGKRNWQWLVRRKRREVRK